MEQALIMGSIPVSSNELATQNDVVNKCSKVALMINVLLVQEKIQGVNIKVLYMFYRCPSNYLIREDGK